jgi:hypothetical protein
MDEEACSLIVVLPTVPASEHRELRLVQISFDAPAPGGRRATASKNLRPPAAASPKPSSPNRAGRRVLGGGRAPPHRATRGADDDPAKRYYRARRNA